LVVDTLNEACETLRTGRKKMLRSICESIGSEQNNRENTTPLTNRVICYCVDIIEFCTTTG
jgi:hypothetical protein